MFEHRAEPLISRRRFYVRMARVVGATGLLVVTFLLLGVAGYHFIAGLDWVDAVYNAAMILTGMGPVHELTTAGAKLFASAYALVSGVVFLSLVAVTIAPVAHRLLHKFHLEADRAKPRHPDRLPSREP